MPNRPVYSMTVVSLALLSCIACGQADSNANAPATATLPPASSLSAEDLATPPIDSDVYIVVNSMKERVAKSQVIVLGTVIEQAEVINGSRDVKDFTKPATASFGVGQLYHVAATTYFKGNGASTITVFNAESTLFDVDPKTVTAADIERMKKVSSLAPLEIGATYLFFLDQYTGVDVPGTYYTGSVGYPWRFHRNQVGVFMPQGPNGGPVGSAGSEFDVQPQDELLPQIEQLVQAEGQK